MKTAVLLFTIASVAAAQELPTGPHEFAWTELPKRRFNAIWVSRESGDLYISNGRTVQVTRDAGQTWEEPLAAGKKGRHWNSISFDGDWKGGRVAIFSVDNPVGHLTLDAGKTWQSFAKPVPPQVKKHDGWTYGHVDWSVAEPTRLFGKEHHSGSFWFSGDAGKTWSELKGVGGYFGFGIGVDGALLCSSAEGNNPVIPGEGRHGIYRSADDGQTWHLVFEGEFNQKVRAHRFDQTMYWPSKAGIVRSHDGGVSWKIMDDTPEDVFFGPIFGKTGNDMLVVCEKGVHQTSDAGKSWTLTLPREKLPEPIKNADFGKLMPCFAWDATRDVLYATSPGEHLYKGAR